MPRFIIDNNLPRDIDIWQSQEFIHVSELDTSYTDTQIWRYAGKHNLIIISKDSDFSNRILGTSAPPQVIHIKLGNYRTRQLAAYMELH